MRVSAPLALFFILSTIKTVVPRKPAMPHCYSVCSSAISQFIDSEEAKDEVVKECTKSFTAKVKRYGCSPDLCDTVAALAERHKNFKKGTMGRTLHLVCNAYEVKKAKKATEADRDDDVLL
ncbi:hypothetical protein OESDEN_11162 [Oesophagostomum dentatum]|uniref:Saposin B-type domain-containing protein n=1 Tax=Oesophagostomum dentatum TaxID=61180 RepID=A0A0B1SZT6_OESDE|nr:hypothetical protein OESDEN_11162 [Oesophagostomum dentatum]